jgi:hypothetical protein
MWSLAGTSETWNVFEEYLEEASAIVAPTSIRPVRIAEG